MKADFLYGTSVLTLPADVKKYLSAASESDMRVLLALASGERDTASISGVCGIGEGEVAVSLAFWRGAGIIKTDGEPAPETKKPEASRKAPSPKSYSMTGEEIERICADKPELKCTVDKCQTIMGKVFTFSEAGVIVYLYDHLRLDCEYILLLCNYCRRQGHDSMRYFEKTAMNLFDRGINSVEALEKYFISESKLGDYEGQIRKLYGMGTRALTSAEREYLRLWAEWEIASELVTASYEEMMKNIPQPKLSYENKILKNWHEAGVKTVDDAKAGGFIGGKSGSSPSFDLDEFFELAVERGKAGAENKK